ncbi:unnamed protein product [Urochloa humidicola]
MEDAGPAGNDGVDSISALPDDILHVIISRLRIAPEVTRTAALSRRWRRVWIHARDLSLVDDDLLSDAARLAFAGFVDWVLAQRGDAGDMDSLHICMTVSDVSLDQINAWIRYGTERVAGDFYLRVEYMEAGPKAAAGAHDQPSIELPGHGRTRSISLHLPDKGIRFPLPAAGRYEALTALALTRVTFAEDREGRAFSDFVSSCCPRLRTLYMEQIWELTRLVLRADALEEFTVFFATFLETLDVAAPSLRVLHLLSCFAVTEARVVAPRLEEIDLRNISHNCSRRPDLEIHGLSSVRRLSEIQLDVHAQYYTCDCDTIVNFWLLENCPGVEDVEFCLHHWENVDSAVDEFDDLTLEGAARFHNARSMFVEANYIPERHLVASVSSLLLRFPGLRSLHIEITDTYRGSLQCLCHQLVTSNDHGKLSLEFLEEVEISGFTGADEEMDLVTLMFNISTSVKSMTLHAALEKKQNSQDGYGDDSLEPIMHPKLIFLENGELCRKLMDISSSDRGHWHFGESVCTWAVLGSTTNSS